jgi:hypothetical protein
MSDLDRLAAAATVVLCIGVAPASAQMFDQPYNHNPQSINPGVAALLRDLDKAKTQGTGVGTVYYDQRVVNLNSNSIGTMSEVSVILEEGAEGLVDLGVEQESEGSQDATANAQGTTNTTESDPDVDAMLDDLESLLGQ